MPRPTSFLVRVCRRLFVCRHGHAFLWRRRADGEWLECFRCLTVRVIAPVVRSAHV